MKTTYRFVCASTVAKVEERKHEAWVSGLAPATGAPAKDVVTKSVSDGVWVTTEGPSPQTFRIGDDNDIGIKPGMTCFIALEIPVIKQDG